MVLDNNDWCDFNFFNAFLDSVEEKWLLEEQKIKDYTILSMILVYYIWATPDCQCSTCYLV